MGCDYFLSLRITYLVNFNPRTHRGVRPSFIWIPYDFMQLFQSTHPSWGATLPFLNLRRQCFYFNPRTHRGVRPCFFFNFKICFHISIHAPIVGCDSIVYLSFLLITISIHAPIVGCDLLICMLSVFLWQFQSTHPSWGAT